MRWPIRLQLLLPMLLLVVLVVVLASVSGTYLAVAGASGRQAEQLRRVASTLTETNFPLSQTVLRRMSGLSGGQFVLLDSDRRVMYGTLPLESHDVAALGKVGTRLSADLFSGRGISLADRDYFAELVPVAARSHPGKPMWLIVLYPKDRWWAIARQVAYPILSAGAIAMLAGMLVTVLLAGRFVRPIKALGDQATAIAAGSFQPLDVPRRDDEIADLTVSLNRMTERLAQYEDEVRRSERLHTLGQLGAGMAHQLRNSATGARLALELLQRELPDAAESESAEVAMQQLQLMESYLQQFLALGRSRSVRRDPVELQSVVDEVLKLIRPTCEHAGISLSCEKSPAPILVKGDPKSLRELLLNLVLNAIEAAGRRPEADARVEIEFDAAGPGLAALRVKDSGDGPSTATRQNLFDPFVTDKPDGTGLGLYVARQIAEDHEGTIQWRREQGMTCFVVELPMVEPSRE